MAPMVLDPGRLRSRLRLEAPADAADGQGGVTRRLGQPLPISGVGSSPCAQRPREEAGAAIAPVSHRVTIRHRDGCPSRHALCVPSGELLEVRGRARSR
jgi:head-tail adaptor